MLRYWINWHQSLGFNLQIIHYNDSLNHLDFKFFDQNGLLLNKKDQINENYLKLLGWDYKMDQNNNNDNEIGILMDYTRFFTNIDNKLSQIINSIIQSNKFIMFDEFNLLSSDYKSLKNLIKNIKNKEQIQIYQDDYLNDLILNYSLNSISNFTNSNNFKNLFDKIPTILINHLKYLKFQQFSNKLNLIDMISIADHYFINEILSIIKSLISPNLSEIDQLIPLPTLTNLQKLLKIKQNYQHQQQQQKKTSQWGKFPDKLTPDSSIDLIELNNQFLLGNYPIFFKMLKFKEISIEILNNIPKNFQQKNHLNIIIFPHPLSTISAINYNDHRIVNNEDILKFKHRNILSNLLFENNYDLDAIKNLIKNDKFRNLLFINFESSIKENYLINLNNQLSIFLGIYNLNLQNDYFGLNFKDNSKSIDEILSNLNLVSSQIEIIKKLNKIRNLINSNENQRPFIINQRQSLTKLQTLQNNLYKINQIKSPLEGIDDIEELKQLLKTQMFEERYDPILEISENWNEIDSNIWYYIKNLRYLDLKIYKYLEQL
ncbi:hypothetical protein WICMUC_003157 [Wickerhamomyces mucosus]|uniref:Uncharacterized protein n=1 Tax=Wickerhamomyces mucosus TaxID=1378264 RepID=A0A9P8TD02_9ASCO|nr:hypothetical protein WICMUC_003157 [Wickerhamomyces mucosus]